MTDQPKDKTGISHGGGLGGNRLDQERTGASIDEKDLTEGERRRGGQSPEPQVSGYSANE